MGPMVTTADRPLGDVGDWSEDRLLGGRLLVRQPRAGYRVAVDTLLLAAAVPRADGPMIELGAGVGGASLAVAARLSAARIVALEREPALAAALAANARANGLSDAVRAVVGDVARAPLRAGRAAVVFFNPPYGRAGAGTPPPTVLGRQARRESAPGLAVWIDVARRLLRPGGELILVHRADRLGEILAALEPAPCRVLPRWPRCGVPAKRVLVRARHGRRGGVRLLGGLVLHREDGHFTAEADAVLRDAAELGWE